MDQRGETSLWPLLLKKDSIVGLSLYCNKQERWDWLYSVSSL